MISTHSKLQVYREPETLPENPGIRHFTWEHALDVNHIMHRIKRAGATFSEGRLPDEDKVGKIQKWPLPQTISQVRGFLGLCGTVQIWIKNYSKMKLL